MPRLIALFLLIQTASLFGADFLWLSDIHFDPLADPALVDRLAAAEAAEWPTILAGGAQEFAKAGHDTNAPLFASALQAAQQRIPNAAFTMVTGDLLVHHFREQFNATASAHDDAAFRSFVRKSMEFVGLQLKQTYPGKPVFLALGNNDDECGDYSIQPNGPFLEDTSKLVAGLAGLKDTGSFLNFGSFAVPNPAAAKHQVIVLDTVFFSAKYNNRCGVAAEDPGAKVLGWLQEQLEGARLRREKIWLVYHIPPGVDVYATTHRGSLTLLWKETYATKFQSLLQQYAATVEANFAGHIHADDIRLLGDTAAVVIAPPLSPITGQNPTFRSVKIDQRGGFLNQTTYYLKDSAWQKEYDFAAEWGVPGSYKELYRKLGKSPELAARWMRFYATSNPETSSITAANFSQFHCAMGHVDAAAYQACMAPVEVGKAERVMTAEGLLAPIKELSSDQFGGRLPGTAGEERSVAYLVSQCGKIGLEPGAPNGWLQTVPLWGTRSQGTLTLTAGGKPVSATARQDYVAWSVLPNPKVSVPSGDLVFVGHGVTADEFHWDDYDGTNVQGKIALVLGGDPIGLTGERALTFYGRTGTKLQNAFAHGALAVILIAAAQPVSANLFQNYSRENMILRGPDESLRVKAQALLTADKAKELFAAAGEDFETLRGAADKRGFRAVPLKARAALQITNQVRKIDSNNVFAKITGSDPQLKNELVVYTGHWDHHGQEGADIFHGASDNAAGSAGVLALARAFKALPTSPRRTMLFFWPTAEEKGLLGAKYYVEHPLYPLSQTIADINLDYFSNWGWGRTRDFSIVGLGNSTLDDITAKAVERQGRKLTGDTAPEQGFYFRSDHYEFARAGVPSLETSPGIDYIGKPPGFGAAKRTEYIRHDYHQPSDVVKPDWDLSGALEDLRILFEVGYEVAQSEARPAWKADAKWRPAR